MGDAALDGSKGKKISSALAHAKVIQANVMSLDPVAFWLTVQLAMSLHLLLANVNKRANVEAEMASGRVGGRVE